MSIAAKAIFARALYGVRRKHFLSQRIYDQPVGKWADYMSYYEELEPGLRTLNWRGEGKAVTVDKLRTAERLTRCDIANASIVACVGRDCEAYPSGEVFPNLNAPAAIEKLLAQWTGDLVVKPATGWRGEGVFKLGRLASGWEVEERPLSNEEAAKFLLQRAPRCGLILQRRLQSHPDLAPVGGDFGLCTIRINTALTKAGPKVLFAFAKLRGAPSLTDNFTGGQSGNMIALIDLRSGSFIRAFGRRPGGRLIEEIDRHPATGEPLASFKLPQWSKATELSLETSAACPEAPLIGLDVGMTSDGPTIVELQSDWGCNGAQLLRGGLRPLLREIVGDLATDHKARELAFKQMNLGPGRRRLSGVPAQRLARAAGL